MCICTCPYKTKIIIDENTWTAHMEMHSCVHTCMHAYIHTCIHTYILRATANDTNFDTCAPNTIIVVGEEWPVRTHTYIYVCVWSHTYICVCIYIYIYIYIYICVSVSHACTYITYIHTYIHAYSERQQTTRISTHTLQTQSLLWARIGLQQEILDFGAPLQSISKTLRYTYTHIYIHT